MLATNPVARQLIKARDYISDPDHWCQGALLHGNRVCAIGALGYADLGQRFFGEPVSITEYSDNFLRSRTILDDTAEKLYGKAAYQVNDSLGHEAVLVIFDKAIETAVVTA